MILFGLFCIDKRLIFIGKGTRKSAAPPLAARIPGEDIRVILKEIPLEQIDVSEFNARKDLIVGQEDSALQDLARSIENQGLLNPITVYQKPDGRYAVLSGQRRMLACRHLGWATITAILRYTSDEIETTALSLVENVHRADMNPRDKARAFRILLDRLGDVQIVSRETGISAATIRKYLHLNELAPELQEKLAEGETRSTDALVKLSQKFEEPETQIAVWDRIEGLPQNAQIAFIKQIEPGLDNLEELTERAAEGEAVCAVAEKHCPFDCPAIPAPLKAQIAEMIEAYHRLHSKVTV